MGPATACTDGRRWRRRSRRHDCQPWRGTHPLRLRRPPPSGQPDAIEIAELSAGSSAAVVTSWRDAGPVLVAVDESSEAWEALEWAAAEAGARNTALRIVHVLRWQPVFDPFGLVLADSRPYDGATHLLEQAAGRAHQLAPEVPVSIAVLAGPLASAIATEASQHALTVVGRPHVPRSSGAHQDWISALLAKSDAAVVVVGLRSPTVYTSGPETARALTLPGDVVVAVDVRLLTPALLGFAFRAALRRGVGLTLLHDQPGGSARDLETPIEYVIDRLRREFPEVPLRRLRSDASYASTPLIASDSASLVIGVRHHRPQRFHSLRPHCSPLPTLQGIPAPVAVLATARARSRSSPRPVTRRRHP